MATARRFDSTGTERARPRGRDVRDLLSRYGDALLATVVGLAFAGEVVAWEGSDLPWAAMFAAAAGFALAWRRTASVLAFLASFAAAAGAIRLAPGIDNDSLGFTVLFFVALYSLGRWARGASVWLGGLCVLGTVVAFIVGDNTVTGEAVTPGDVGFAVLFVGTPWAAGFAIRLRRERESALVEQGELAISRERARIARELHDVVSHAISVTVLQARGGRAMIGRDEEAVRRALDAIEETNTAALSDMRRLLAVLRDTDTHDGRAAPQPSLANLDRLVEQVRSAGVDVRVAVAGEPGPVPPGVDLSAYRIVQEALTNVLKHAGPTARAEILVAYAHDHLRVSVRDDGVGRLAGDPGGHGLAGIRERVAVVGGTVDAGPLEGGGFVVSASLPYALEPTS